MMRRMFEIPDRREATEDDPPCSCGRTARYVYATQEFGDIPHCGISDVRPLASRFGDPRWKARWLRRLCAHADQNGEGMHWLEPGEVCQRAETQSRP